MGEIIAAVCSSGLSKSYLGITVHINDCEFFSMFDGMSSNLILKRICQHCGQSLIAKKTSTKFCSLACGRRNYKVRERMNKIEEGDARAKANAFQLQTGPQAFISPPEQEFIDIKRLAFVTSMSERMIFNLIKDPNFPRLKIGRRLLFEKKAVMDYLVKKYGNW